MATLKPIGTIYATGDATALIDAAEFYLDNGVGLSSVSLPIADVNNVYVNCARTGVFGLDVDNPAVDTVAYFSFPIDWTDVNSVTGTSTIWGMAYHSLGHVNISTTLVGNAIGDSTRDVGLLCSSAQVNKYAQYHPSGSSPFLLGDFRRYAHNTPGGLILKDTSLVTTIIGSPDGGTETPGDLSGVGSKMFFPLTGTTFAYVKLWIDFNTQSLAIIQADLSTAQFLFITSHAVNSVYLNYAPSYVGLYKTYTLMFSMSVDGVIWVTAPAAYFLTGTVYYQAPIFNASVSNWNTLVVPGSALADISITNNSAGAATAFQMRVRTVYQIGTDPVVDDAGTYSTVATLDNGITWTSSQYLLGYAQAGTVSFKVYVYMKAGTSGTEYLIAQHVYL